METLEVEFEKAYNVEFEKGCEAGAKFREQIDGKIISALEKIVRENSLPPITGKITKGKVKWRGLKLCHEFGVYRIEYWIEQRGIIIGSPVVMDFSILAQKKEPE